MATKIRDYAKLAADIREAVGPENIISAANCATRPRLVLKETPLGGGHTANLRDARRHQGDGERRPVPDCHRHPRQGLSTNGVQFKCLNAAFLFRKRSFPVRPPS